MSWNPKSWRDYPIAQQPTYEDPEALAAALQTLSALPPLVAPGEIDRLRQHLANAAEGKAFVLQGGDCAESFAQCNQEAIEAKLKILMQMSLVLTFAGRIPIIRIGRMAGQYAKPRSSDFETVNGVEIPSYRGDIIHDIAPTPEARRPDPRRMVEAYFRAAATLNYTRALLDGGFADLRRPQHWAFDFVKSSEHRAEYEALVERIMDALDFVESTGVSSPVFSTAEIFSSHEGLLLPYEEALTRAATGGRHYNLGAHMLWIGDRTRQLDGAHVQYFRGLENPVGIKVGPTMQPNELLTLLERIEPEDRPGRVTLITRFGADKVEGHLPPLIAKVQEAGRHVLWSCDPMHGNTTTVGKGLKTRSVAQIHDELGKTFAIHTRLGSHLGGVHFELTGEDVTECIGGPQELAEADLARSYETYCDPRLNYAQSLAMAFFLAKGLEARRNPSP